MKKKSTILILILFGFFPGFSQSVLTIQPDPSTGKDALLHGLSSQKNSNFGTNPQFVANAWTFGGEEATIRSVIDFDLSGIPESSSVLSAYLQLFAYDSNNGMGQHSTESGENTCLLQRITSNWSEQSITWSTQPSTTEINQVETPFTYYATQNFILDVTKLVIDMKNNPTKSFGFMLKLKYETSKRRMNFASSDHTNNQLRPKLVIVYSSPTNTNCFYQQPNFETGKDAILHGLNSEANKNFGNNAQFVANAWTFSGSEAKIRSIIDFDLSKLPKNIEIEDAFLSLYAWGSNSGMGTHFNNEGSNECWVERVTSNWDELNVTWNNQPTTTTENRVFIDNSINEKQNFIVDISTLIRDYYENPNSSFGFMLKLKNETAKRRMNFASSDHDTINFRPKLMVSYKIKNSVIYSESNVYSIFPNPASDVVYIFSDENNNHVDIKVFDLKGSTVLKNLNYKYGEPIDVKNLAKGIYIISVINNLKVINKKLFIY